jgi:hypothetical protein
MPFAIIFTLIGGLFSYKVTLWTYREKYDMIEKCPMAFLKGGVSVRISYWAASLIQYGVAIVCDHNFLLPVCITFLITSKIGQKQAKQEFINGQIEYLVRNGQCSRDDAIVKAKNTFSAMQFIGWRK